MLIRWFPDRRGCITGVAVALIGGLVDLATLVNLVSIGDYEHPKVRLPGSGGACEIAIHARQILVETLEYTKERKAFGQGIGSFQHNKFLLAEMFTQVDVTLRAAREHQELLFISQEGMVQRTGVPVEAMAFIGSSPVRQFSIITTIGAWFRPM